MALGLTGGGNTNAVKYDAKVRMIKVGSEDGEREYEIGQFAGIFDFPNCQVGWVSFQPFDDSHLVRHEDIAAGKIKFPKRPGDGYRSGFRIMVKLSKQLGSEVKEFMSSAMATCQGVDELHDLYLAAPESKQGKLPVVVITGTEAIKSQQGTNYRPKFAIRSWVDRPADLNATGSVSNGHVDDDDIPFDAPPAATRTSAPLTTEPEF